MLSAPEWLGDPTGRHVLRYWDGTYWTRAVSDGGGARTDDELAEQPPPAVALAGWYPDPALRHQLRFWDGVRWTSKSCDNGGVVDDPVDPSAPPPSATIPGWYRDPAGRHNMRWWNGDLWSAVVSTGSDVTNEDADPSWPPPITTRLAGPAPVGMRSARKVGWHLAAKMVLKAQGRDHCPRCGGKLTVVEVARPGHHLDYTPETTDEAYPPCAHCGFAPPWSTRTGLYRDPTGRHEYRYWDGQTWTDRVADAGEGSSDPVAVSHPDGHIAPATRTLVMSAAVQTRPSPGTSLAPPSVPAAVAVAPPPTATHGPVAPAAFVPAYVEDATAAQRFGLFLMGAATWIVFYFGLVGTVVAEIVVQNARNTGSSISETLLRWTTWGYRLEPAGSGWMLERWIPPVAIIVALAVMALGNLAGVTPLNSLNRARRANGLRAKRSRRSDEVSALRRNLRMMRDARSTKLLRRPPLARSLLAASMVGSIGMIALAWYAIDSVLPRNDLLAGVGPTICIVGGLATLLGAALAWPSRDRPLAVGPAGELAVLGRDHP